MSEALPAGSAVDPAGGDWFLQRLVRLANVTGVEIGITLTVGGSIISGELTGGREYFEAVAEQVRSAVPGEVGEAMSDFFRKGAKVYVLAKEEANEVSGDLIPPNYLHLRNAKHFAPGSEAMPSGDGMWWRGRIAEVSGFTVGSLGPRPPADPAE